MKQTQASEDVISEKSTAGTSDYDRNSSQQHNLILSHYGILRRLVQEIGVVEPEFRVVDYGAGSGHTAINAVRPVIEAYRQISPQGPVVICHADLPHNDWNALFALATGRNGYSTGNDAIRIEAAVGSFYESMAAPKSVSLAISFTSTHWLSRPVRIHAPGAIYFGDLQGTARAEMAALADADWTAFLRERAQELRPGGYLLVGGLGATVDPSLPGGYDTTARHLYHAIQLVLQGMATDGLIKQDMLDAYLFPSWIRTLDELRAPLDREADLNDSFDLVSLEVRPAAVHPDDTFGDYLGDPVRYGESYAGLVRGFSHSPLTAQIFRPSAKNDVEAEEIADEFYRRLAELYRDHPGKYPVATWVSTIILRRRLAKASKKSG
jgi:hypothetical protein